MANELSIKPGKIGNGKTDPKVAASRTYEEDFNAIGEDVTALKEDVMSLGNHVGTDAIDSARAQAGKVRVAAREGAKELREAIRRNPATSVLTAFAVGVAVNAFFKSKAR